MITTAAALEFVMYAFATFFSGYVAGKAAAYLRGLVSAA